MNCAQCGGPLPPKSNICTYCGALNDIDLRALQRGARQGPATDRLCPRCDVQMSTIDIGSTAPFLIERCDTCLGLFFDPRELQALLEPADAAVSDVDVQRMTRIIEDECVSDYTQVQYVKCPICRDLMTRKAYGARSGVVTDVCANHGVWLDGGELGQLLKWARAGGRLFHRQQQDESRRQERVQRRIGEARTGDQPDVWDILLNPHQQSSGSVIELLLRSIGRLMR